MPTVMFDPAMSEGQAAAVKDKIACRRDPPVEGLVLLAGGLMTASNGTIVGAANWYGLGRVEHVNPDTRRVKVRLLTRWHGGMGAIGGLFDWNMDSGDLVWLRERKTCPS